MNAQAPVPSSVLSDRYAIFGELASGGMASVLYGRLKGPVGFARAVAIKRMHPHIAREPSFVSMFIDEARICARLSHANIVPTLDVIQAPSELCLVMEYVHGAALDVLIDIARARGERVPVRVAVALIAGVLHGLHAAHETRDEEGHSLGVVHRDVSPPNVLVGEDGIARVLDFGIAKAAGKLRTTPSGEVKGKLAYMAAEQFRGGEVDRRVDIYGAATVLWETLVGRPLFDGASESEIVYKVLNEEIAPPSQERPEVSQTLDGIVTRALSRDPEQRFQTAREMALALELQVGGASQSEVSEWVRTLAGAFLDARAAELRNLQQGKELPGDPVAREGEDRGTRRLSPLPLGAQTPTPTMETDELPSARRGKVKWGVLLALGGGVLALALYGGLGGGSERPAPSQPEQPASEGAQPALPAVPPPTLAPVADVPPAAASEESREAVPALAPGVRAHIEDAATPSVDARVRRAADARTRSAKRTDTSQASPPPAARREEPADKADCSPPYRWSPQGVKVYKRECL